MFMLQPPGNMRTADSQARTLVAKLLWISINCRTLKKLTMGPATMSFSDAPQYLPPGTGQGYPLVPFHTSRINTF